MIARKQPYQILQSITRTKSEISIWTGKSKIVEASVQQKYDKGKRKNTSLTTKLFLGNSINRSVTKSNIHTTKIMQEAMKSKSFASQFI
jgi:hypothetical protein